MALPTVEGIKKMNEQHDELSVDIRKKQDELETRIINIEN